MQVAATDSLLLEIRMEEVYQDMQVDHGLYDTSDYLPDHFLHSKENKNVVDKMKDEWAGTPSEEVACLRSEMYSVKTAMVNIRKAKGMSKVVTKKELHHQSYLEALYL